MGSCAMSEHARTALCLLRTPCTCCRGLALLHGSVLKTPPDAVLLSEYEARTYTDQLQGTWEVLPTELPDDPCCGGSQQYTGYSKVFVEESRMTFSGGRQGRMETQTLQLHRSPAGELYLDSKGTLCTQFSPETGQVRARNALGFGILRRREEGAVTSQPNLLLK